MKAGWQTTVFICGLLTLNSWPSEVRDARVEGVALKNETANYVLGSGDTITLSVLQAPEISDNRPIRIDFNGQISLPYIGQVQASGMTALQLQQELAARLKKIIKEPQVLVTIVEVNSQPVSVLGAVNLPGVHQIRDPKLLTDMLSMAGGLRQDAGASVVITRRAEQGKIPLPSAKTDATGGFYVARVGTKDLMEAKRPENNIVIRPFDVISVPVAQMVYVMGEVYKPGGFVLGERSHISLTEALALAGGLNHTANAASSKLLRSTSGAGVREEVSVDIKRVLQGKDRDLQLDAEDIVYVPGNAVKAAKIRAIEAAIQVGTGIAIWRP